MKKTILIDTNLYLDDPNIIYKLANTENKILIPMTVLKELDKHKFNKDLSYSARGAIRAILDFMTSHPEQIEVDTTKYDGEPDERIIQSAKNVGAVLATKDVSMSIQAKTLGLESILHDVVLNNIFKPYIHMTMYELLEASDEDTFAYGNEYVDEEYENVLTIVSKIAGYEVDPDTWFFVIIDVEKKEPIVYANNPLQQKLIRIDSRKKYRVIETEGSTIEARDCYQICAIYALEEAPHVLMTGRWGSGKTLLASAHALSKGKKKTFITRAPIGINSRYDVGFLPGPQPLYAKVLTPHGWKTMGEIKPGDYVISANGTKSKVLEVFYKGEKDVYEIRTTNGGRTFACGDHVWATKTNNELKHNYDFKIRTTNEIKETLFNENSGDKFNHTLPMNGIVEFEQTHKLPIPAYTLGVLLGDGCFTDSISFAANDEEIANRVSREITPMGIYLRKYGISYTLSGKYKSNKPPKPVILENIHNGKKYIYKSISEAGIALNVNKTTINSRCIKNLIIGDYKYAFGKAARWTNTIKNSIFKLGLHKKKAKDKFIPDIYKYASIEDRLALIQGIMDTDGTIKKSTGEQTLTTISKKLADDVIEVARSLGINATVYERNRIGYTTKRPYSGNIITKHISYEVSLPKSNKVQVFSLKRKLDRVKPATRNRHVKIKDIRYIGKEQTKCIKIDSENELYITDDFIVTHNTLEDKMLNWLQGFMSALYHIYGSTRDAKDGNGGTYDHVREVIFPAKFEVIAMNAIQGLSLLDKDVLIVDESQLITVDYMSMILSRPSETGKLILLGDIKQAYDVVKPSESGLLKLLRVLPHKYMAYVELQNSYRSPLLEVADKLMEKGIV